MKIKTNKLYKTRGGGKVIIYNTKAGGDYPIHGAEEQGDNTLEMCNWTANGKMYGTDTIDSQDIVGEWKEYEVKFEHWDDLPSWINKYISQEPDGVWFAWSKKPTKDESGYFSHSGDFVHIPKKMWPNYKGDWKESVTLNPKYI